MQQFTLTQIIKKVQHLIDTGIGDSGRLYHILEFLKNKKTLYNSDQIYLENKLDTSFSLKEESVIENEFLPKIQHLIDAGNGDPGRLQHIYDTLENNKPLYYSDHIYLESKLNPSVSESSVPKIEPTKQAKKHVLTLREVSTKLETKSEIRGTLPKGWNPNNDSNELETISKNIKDEEEKIKGQQKISNEINLKKLNLTKLIYQRKEFEEKVNLEKSSLESDIKNEQFKIKTQTKLSEEINAQTEELLKVKKESTEIIKNINSEKLKISTEFAQQKKQLSQAKLEEEKIKKQAQKEQLILLKLTEEQKSRLVEQTKIAHEIKSKQSELKKTKQDFNEITFQVNKEKAKFEESKKLEKLIKIQEEDLIKAKESRLHLITVISKEKVIISKKLQDEKKRLKSQSELAKKLKNEEKFIESLKKKRKKMEEQIKIKNQKLKDKQQKLKIQINEKNRKLKSFAKKSLPKTKKIIKKPSKKKLTKNKFRKTKK